MRATLIVCCYSLSNAKTLGSLQVFITKETASVLKKNIRPTLVLLTPDMFQNEAIYQVVESYADDIRDSVQENKNQFGPPGFTVVFVPITVAKDFFGCLAAYLRECVVKYDNPELWDKKDKVFPLHCAFPNYTDLLDPEFDPDSFFSHN